MGSSVYDQQIVIDLEWTIIPKKRRSMGLCAEVVEIGAVRVDSQGDLLDTFSCFVKPQQYWQVSGHVTNLTGIQTSDVHDADDFAVAIRRFADWIGEGRTRMVAWSDSDRNQIRNECAAKGVAVPSQLSRWLNLQLVYPRVMEVGNGQHMALKTAADWYGVAVEDDSAHRALYDAKVTAKLLRLLMTGEYRQHKAALRRALSDGRHDDAPLSASLGSRCGNLAELYAQMTKAG